MDDWLDGARCGTSQAPVIRIAFDDIVTELTRVLESLGFSPSRARQSATLFAETHQDGVTSHGLNRFPRFVRQIKAGHVRPGAEPVLAAAFGAWEQWDGQLGPGNLNATFATDRAVSLAREHALGLVALRNTNHWMRGGSYGWQAARAGMAFIGWTNTWPNMPPWGTVTSKLGNTPVIIAIPRGEAPVVLDVAMSQFSYGKMEMQQLRGEMLPMPGGYDTRGQLSADPAEILKSQRPLPIGYWKGAGLSMVFDMLGAILGSGRTTHEIGRQPDEYGLSQVFLCVDVARAGGADAVSRIVTAVADDVRSAAPAPDGSPGRYPGEGVLRVRVENQRLGIPVDVAVWNEIKGL
jgi:3-dehydro-L-gulonate 2-dehydrogenase